MSEATQEVLDENTIPENNQLQEPVNKTIDLSSLSMEELIISVQKTRAKQTRTKSHSVLLISKKELVAITKRLTAKWVFAFFSSEKNK